MRMSNSSVQRFIETMRWGWAWACAAEARAAQRAQAGSRAPARDPMQCAALSASASLRCLVAEAEADVEGLRGGVVADDFLIVLVGEVFDAGVEFEPVVDLPGRAEADRGCRGRASVRRKVREVGVDVVADIGDAEIELERRRRRCPSWRRARPAPSGGGSRCRRVRWRRAGCRRRRGTRSSIGCGGDA